MAKKALLDHPVPDSMWPDLHAIKDDHILAPLVVKCRGVDVPVWEYETVLIGSLVKLNFWAVLNDENCVSATLNEIEVLLTRLV